MKQIVSILIALVCLFAVPTSAAPSTATSDSAYPATADEAAFTVTATEQPTTAETITTESTEAPTEAETTEEVYTESSTDSSTEDVDIAGEESYDSDNDYDSEYDSAEYENEDEIPVATPVEYNGYYSEYDLDLLARVICVEAGCSWIPDWVQLYVGSVVLNRVNSSMYPDTIEGVLYDPGQYNPYALYNYTPDDRTIANARQLLENGSVLPADVLGQNGECTGDGIYDSYYDSVLGSTVYFTYVYGY